MKIIKLFIAVFLLLELLVFAHYYRGLYLDPEKPVPTERGHRPKRPSELPYEYRIWKIISDISLRKDKFHKAKNKYYLKGKINVAISGNYNIEDSLYLNSLMHELNSIMSNGQLSWGGINKNIGLGIGLKIENTDHRGTTYGGKHSGGISVEENIFLPDSSNQRQRNQMILFEFVDAITNIESPAGFSMFVNELEQTVVNDNWSLYKLTETDKYLIKILYSKHRYFTIFKKYPLLFFEHFKKFHESKTRILFTINSFFLIGLYFVFLISRGIFVQKPKNWWQFNKQAFWAYFSFIVLIILQTTYESSPRVNWFSQFTENYFNLIFTILTIFCPGFAITNLIFFSEKIINRSKSPLHSKLLLRIIASFFFPFVLMTFLALSPAYFMDFYSKWLLLILFIIGGRSILMFHNYTVQNAVKEKDLELAQIKALQQQSELQAIHSRINPHFLYNSLNSIASFASISPEKTEKMALSLSRFFRFAINKTNEEFVAVKDELEIVETYLEIEKIRFGDKLHYIINCEEELKDKPIPRFIIQPLVENAIKHGIRKMVEAGEIIIDVNQEGKNLKISVSDNGSDFPEEPLHGYGLQSIYDKLQLHYKKEACIAINNKPNKSIIIYLPLTLKKA